MIKKPFLFCAFPFGRMAFGIFWSHIVHFQFVSKAYRGQFQPNTGVCARPRPGLHKANHFRDFLRHMEIAFNWKKSHIGGFGTGKRALAPVRGPRSISHTFATLCRKNLTGVRFCGLIPQVNAVGLAYGNLHILGFIWAIKSVIPHECTYARILPTFAGSIFKTNGIIF